MKFKGTDNNKVTFAALPSLSGCGRKGVRVWRGAVGCVTGLGQGVPVRLVESIEMESWIGDACRAPVAGCEEGAYH